MADKLVGNSWLQKHYKLNLYKLTKLSYIGNNNSLQLDAVGNIEQVYGPKYAVAEEIPLLQLEFALKYDHINLDFIREVLLQIPPEDITAFIEQTPSGKYARKIGFLFEFLTGKKLEIQKEITGNYLPLLEEEKYFTGNIVRNLRWRIQNNLLGTPDYCPVVRRTRKLEEILSISIPDKIDGLKNKFSPEIFRRAINFLYTKETRSSYEIEREKPSADRMDKFVALLMKAGTEEHAETLSMQRLVELQNAIVDPRYAAAGYRDFQNYVGESLKDFREQLHYVCPPPAILEGLMKGITATAEKSKGLPAEVRAAILSFGFVFLHPFEDGNGRLHRFLIHDVLVQDGIVPQGLIIPVSAHMLNHMGEYDSILEQYSKPLMQRIKFNKEELGEIEVSNPQEVDGYFRYPDLTEQCLYLTATIHATLQEDMPQELLFIQRYDEVKRSLQRIVDMPDKDINLMIMFLHQNNGILSKGKREHFKKLTEKEMDDMQAEFREVFEMDRK
ncbi:MAG: Fic family protein [Rhizobacter sp.]|nr:Fic family protein [Ferruginibacter sp.]